MIGQVMICIAAIVGILLVVFGWFSLLALLVSFLSGLAFWKSFALVFLVNIVIGMLTK